MFHAPEYCERYAKPEDAGIVTEKPSHQEITDYELDSGDESNDSPVDPQPASLTEDDEADAGPLMDPQPPSSL